MEITPYSLGRMVNEAASGFSESKDLNKEVAKVAEANELTPTQIQALVEESNHEVYRRLYKTAEDKRFTFNMAETDKVLDLLHPGESKLKVAEVSSVGFDELRIDFTREKRASEKIAQPIPDWIRDDNARLRTTKHLLRGSSDELKKYAEQFRQKANYSKLAAAEAASRFLHEVQQNVRNGIPYQTLYKLAVAQAPDFQPAIQGVFEDIREEYLKTATEVETDLLEFDPEKIDGKDEIGTRVVNGNNPLFIHLTTILDECKNRFLADPLSRHLEDTASAIVSSMHRLNTPDDVDSYIANEAQRFAHAVKMGSDEAITACGILEFERLEQAGENLKTAAAESPWLAEISKGAAGGAPATVGKAISKLPVPGASLAGSAVRGTGEALKAAPGRMARGAKGLVSGGKGLYEGAKWLGKGKKLFLPKGRIYEMMFSPAGFGSGKGGQGTGLAGLATALYGGGQALEGAGRAASQFGEAALSPGERITGIGMAR